MSGHRETNASIHPFLLSSSPTKKLPFSTHPAICRDKAVQRMVPVVLTSFSSAPLQLKFWSFCSKGKKKTYSHRSTSSYVSNVGVLVKVRRAAETWQSHRSFVLHAWVNTAVRWQSSSFSKYTKPLWGPGPVWYSFCFSMRFNLTLRDMMPIRVDSANQSVGRWLAVHLILRRAVAALICCAVQPSIVIVIEQHRFVTGFLTQYFLLLLLSISRIKCISVVWKVRFNTFF